MKLLFAVEHDHQDPAEFSQILKLVFAPIGLLALRPQEMCFIHEYNINGVIRRMGIDERGWSGDEIFILASQTGFGCDLLIDDQLLVVIDDHMTIVFWRTAFSAINCL